MPSAPISFANQQATGSQVLSGAPGVAVNVIVDSTGAVRRRPGLAESASMFTGGLGVGIVGIYATVSGAIYAVTDVPNYRVIGRVLPNTVNSLVGSPATLDGTLRPVFAETQLILVIAGGGAMQKVVLTSDASSRLGGDPPLSSHVVANNSRLLGNIANVSMAVDFDKSAVRFSDISNGNSSYAGLEVWTEGLSLAGHFFANATPDAVLAIAQNTNEVFCFGTTSLQVFDPDPAVDPVSGIPTGYGPAVAKELGCAAPYSIVKINQQFAWLDNFRRFVMSDGRSESVISDPIQKTLDDMSTVSDCFGYRVITGPFDGVVWTFPTDGRTFAFQKGSGWAEWLGWNVAAQNFEAFQVTASCIDPATHDVLLGTSDGFLGKFSLDASTDFGVPINASVETAYLDRGSDNRKHSKCVRVGLRRGQTTNATAPQARLSWRDQPGAYSPPIEISLGELGDTEIVVSLRSLGTYRRRQWKFEFSGTEALELVGVTEEFDVLGS